MNKKSFIYILTILLICLVSFFAIKSINETSSTLSQKEVFNYLFKARQANMAFKYNEADQFYQHIVNSNNKKDVLEEYLFFLVAQRDFKKSFDVAQQILLFEPKHYLANLILTSYLIKSNQLDEAIYHLSSINADKQSIHDIILIMLKGIKSYENNQETKFEQEATYIKEMAPDLYYYEIGMFNLYVNNTNKAKEIFEYVNNNYPNTESVINYAKLLYVENPTKSTEYFKDYLSDNFLSNEKAVSYIQDKPILTLQSIYSDILLRLALLIPSELNQNLMVSNSFILSNLAFMLDDENDVAKLSIANFYDSLGNYNDALTFYLKIEDSSFYKRVIIYKILDIYTTLQQEDKSISLLKSYSSTDNDNPTPLLELGRIFHKQGDYEKAISLYKDALDISLKNNYVLGKYLSYYYSGVSYDKMGNWNLAEQNLLLAKNINNQDPLLVNYLAYSWIDRNINLKEALFMLKNALKISPVDANILDSYAWGLFKTKDYKNALKYSIQANKINSYDAQINDHLGDLYFVNKNPKQAHYYWQSAVNLTQDEILKESINKKLNKDIPAYLVGNKSKMVKKT